MTSSLDPLTFTVPLTAANRSAAQTMAEKMPNAAKAHQVERNILAVLATQYYLKLLGFSSNANPSFDLLHQWADSAAALIVQNGIIDCYPISSGQTALSLPKLSSHKLGYVVVELSDDYHEAKMLGVAPATATQLAVHQLQPLDTLVDCLTETPLIQLQTWLERQSLSVWTTLDSLMSPEREPHIVMATVELDRQSTPQQRLAQMIQELHEQTGIAPVAEEPTTNLSQLIQQVQNDELRWRAAELLWELDPDHPSSPIIRAKDLGLYLAGHSIALLVGLLPKADNQTLVLVRVCSIGASPVLPSGIQFVGEDIDGNQIFDLLSRRQDDYIQFKFTADVGDRFTLKVGLEDAQIIENFLV
ncbi:MAG: DUF1822 family protein [Cyanobacteria bacterium P01_F01_bin.13]